MNRLVLFFVFVITFLLTSCAGTVAKSENVTPQTDAQKAEILRFNLAKELAQIDTMLRADSPSTVVAHESFLRALDMVEAGKLNFAELFYKRALANAPQSDFLLSELIRILLAQNKKNEAFPLLKLSVMTEKARSEEFYALARIYREKNNLDSSQFYYKKTLETREDNLIFYEYSQILEFTKNYAELRQIYDVLLPKLGYPPQLMEKQIILYQITHAPDSAFVALLGNAFAEHGIAYAEYGILQAEILMKQKKYNEANEVLLTIFFMHPSKELTSKLALRIADNYEKMDSLVAAIMWLEQLLTKEPDNHVAMNNLGYMLIEHNKDIKRGFSLVEKALGYEPNEFSYLDSKAWGLYKLGKFEEALKVFELIEPRGIELEKNGANVSELWEHLLKTCEALKLDDRVNLYKEKLEQAKPKNETAK